MQGGGVGGPVGGGGGVGVVSRGGLGGVGWGNGRSGRYSGLQRVSSPRNRPLQLNEWRKKRVLADRDYWGE